MSKVIPFGKYKGQPLEVLIQDKNYTDWILSQEGIKNKYPEIVNVIINNFQEPSETPEHNAMQVKFLRKNFPVALYSLFTGIEPSFVSKHVCFQVPVFEEEGIDVYFYCHPKEDDFYKESGLYKERIDSGLKFWERGFKVEIKHTVGDEFPAILRQIRSSKNINPGDLNFLLLNSYNGKGASLKEFQEYFNTSNIGVVFEKQIDDLVREMS